MKRFAALYAALDGTTSTRAKLDALAAYFRASAPDDAAWAAYFLAGGKPRQVAPTRLLRELACQRAGLDDWLFDECYESVGDLAETIAHVLPAPSHRTDLGLARWVEDRLLPLRGMPSALLAERILAYWDELDDGERFVMLKLIGGGFRVGVSRQLVTRALGEVALVDHKRIAQRMVGFVDAREPPTAERYLHLVAEHDGALPSETGLPYPFFLAHQLQGDVAALGEPADWQIEWKWDGIRAQIVKRDGQVWIWSRGEDLLTARFPELASAAAALPEGTVLDGEILAWADGADAPLPFARLQPRITRKTLTAKIVADAPAVFVAYDLLESAGLDRRLETQAGRRAHLEALLAPLAEPALRLSAQLDAADWGALARLRAQSRSRNVEGLMLKQRAAHYGVGRTKSSGTWWKWKLDPYTVDAVLIYAQRGHGRRASLYTDYTFAVWDAPPGRERTLVPFAKAYSGLTDAEIRQVDAIVRKTTVEKFGPVRSVQPSLVFEIGFEGIQRSPRHKSGVAVRFPRMLRWRTDKPVADADTLAILNALLDTPAGPADGAAGDAG